MHKIDENKCKSDTTDTTITSPKAKTSATKEKGRDVTKRKSMGDSSPSSGSGEMEVPENFSEMERKIFLAHKNAVEVM